MSADFPNSPTIGQICIHNNANWRFDGTAWILASKNPHAQTHSIGDVDPIVGFVSDTSIAIAATVTAKTITITENPGAATCTQSIATAKGWTVTG